MFILRDPNVSEKSSQCSQKVKYIISVQLIIRLSKKRKRERGGGAERDGDRGSEAGSVLTAENLMPSSNS